MKSLIFFIMLVLAPFIQANPQTPATGDKSGNGALLVFLDCDACDMDYIRTEFNIVNYVNEPAVADVHVLISSIANGSGGISYLMTLNGRNNFAGQSDTLIFSTSSDDTEDMIREKVLGRIKLGLVPFLMKTPSIDKIDLSVDEDPFEFSFDDKDPWKNWVFEIYGMGSFASQKTGHDLSLSGSVYASKVTEKIKIETANGIGYSNTSLRYFDGDSVIFSMESKQKYLSSSNLAVVSIGKHCGIGGTAAFRQSDYSNLDFQVITGPAVEFNLFDYSEASRRQFRFLYTLSYEHSLYSDTTVYNKMQDDLFRHQLDIIFSYLDDWGTISISASGTNYLSHLSQYSIGASGVASVRLFKGFSLSISAGCSYFQNQISLKKDIKDLNGILTGQYELEKGLSYNVLIGLSYRFGSVNNNTVNPRFEL